MRKNIASWLKSAEYQSLFNEVDLETVEVDEVHNGYFSIDKNGRSVETAENNQANRDNAERAYNLILKEKEKLLSFDTKLKFIFSHSALKEGWDNPNVFQICTLRDMGSERERRQTLGRGLRLCVNQNGERLRGNDVNTLTVIATENYEKFAENLQKEIEEDTGIRFGIVEPHQFATIHTLNDKGVVLRLWVWSSQRRFGSSSKISNSLMQKAKCRTIFVQLLKDGNFELPQEIKQELIKDHGEEQAEIIASDIRGDSAKTGSASWISRTPMTGRSFGHGRPFYESDDFRLLWERIKHKTTYRVEFDNLKLLNDCAVAIKELSSDNQNSCPVQKGRHRHRRRAV